MNELYFFYFKMGKNKQKTTPCKHKSNKAKNNWSKKNQ